MTSTRAVLRVPGFSRLAIAYTVNELGDSLGAVALALLVFDETGSAMATAALFIATRFLPAFLAPALTARVDRFVPRRALPAIYLAEAAAFGALAATAELFLLPLLLVLTLIDGTLALTGRALTRAAMFSVLRGEGELRAGNAVVNVGFAVAAAAGALLGGLIVAGLGVTAALALDAASFLVIALLLATARTLPARGELSRERWGARLRAGLAYVRGHRWVRALLGLQAMALLFFTIVVPIEVVYVKDALGTGDAGLGALLGAWGGGIVLGSLAFARLGDRSTVLLVALATAGVGAAYLGLAGAQTLLVACVLSVLGGFGNGVQWVAVMTAVQQAVGADYQARVVGLLESIGAAVPGIGFLLGGALTSVLSARAAYAVAGGGALLVVAAIVVVLGRIPLAERAAPPPAAPVPRRAADEDLVPAGPEGSQSTAV
jgi:MFS family permease